ncbi:hypothetical protein DSO57_1002798 [Entomophthora muscae]|uniref:Uncharacterized protein n=1 Tax=Entomophthora muscae TaxID=34485 RepID=A0ACC2SAQ1_9FUNG|nr:hypothetical protein DSO57_1002798 [Entomophthora muscae]
MPANQELSTATLAGGCFWGIEHFFRKEFGAKLINLKVGYIGGDVDDPTYLQVKKGQTGHVEAVQFRFDPKQVSYHELIHYFFRIHDPTTEDRQLNDVGTQYRSAIFYHSEDQKLVAQQVIKQVQPKIHGPIITQLVPISRFFCAEEYHQDYLTINPQGECNHWLRW